MPIWPDIVDPFGVGGVLWPKINSIMQTGMDKRVATKLSQTSANVTAAKSRLKNAVDRLEKAIAAKADSANQELSKELDAARAEVSGLKSTNENVSLRLDGAINKMKLMLEDS